MPGESSDMTQHDVRGHATVIEVASGTAVFAVAIAVVGRPERVWSSKRRYGRSWQERKAGGREAGTMYYKSK